MAGRLPIYKTVLVGEGGVARGERLGDRRGQVLRDRFAVNTQALGELALGPLAMPVGVQLDQVEHVETSPRHQRPFHATLRGIERTRVRGPSPAATPPRVGELRDRQGGGIT